MTQLAPVPTRPAILVAIEASSHTLAQLAASYTVHQATTPAARMDLARRHGTEIAAVVTNGTTLIDAALIVALPRLGIICAQGVGHEGVDLVAARARGITVTHGPGTNAESVADHAMALMLAVLRDIPGSDARVRAGFWRPREGMRPTASGKRLGILGLGDIGGRIATRAGAFNMPVAYHNRRPLPDSPHAYHPSVLALAAASDVLMVVLPGGAGTRHLVGPAELEALGPAGFLVNVGRGSVVDTAALVAALQAGRLAGAALDVVDGEPDVPQALLDLPQLVITPHVAGRAPESTAAMVALLLQNLAAHFAGQPPLTPIPPS